MGIDVLFLFCFGFWENFLSWSWSWKLLKDLVEGLLKKKELR